MKVALFVVARAAESWARTVVCAVAAVAIAPTALATGATAAVTRTSTTDQLTYNGGWVLHSSAPYLIYWTPRSGSIPAGSQSLMERFFSDTAAASGLDSNVFAVDRQYYDNGGFADARETFDSARQVIVDTQPYPPRLRGGCADVSRLYPTCINESQIQAELERLITTDGLPTAGQTTAAEPAANAAVFFVVLPADVEVCRTSGSPCSDKLLSAFHLSFTDKGGRDVLYAVIPYAPGRNAPPYPGFNGCEVSGTPVPQKPNGDPADCRIDAISHEYSETITDPNYYSGWFNSHGSGFDPLGQEGGDQCELFGPFNPQKGANPNAFLPTLGGSAAAGTLYDQLINGHPYYIQGEWSDGDRNCEMRPSPGKIAPRFAVTQGPRAAIRSLTFNPAASTSTNALSSATWNYGDGSPTGFFSGKSALTPAKHRYRRAGRYTATLTLVDNRGNLQSTTSAVTVPLG